MNAAVTTRRRAHAKRRGMSMFYLMIILALTFATASLALDYGRVQLAKTELQIVTDSSAKWGAYAADGGVNAVLIRANAAAADNKVNGMTHAFNASDVQVGSWNSQTRVFTNNGVPRNAVKLTGTAVIPLMLGNLIQKPSVTVRASAVAKVAGTGGMTGLSGIEFKNNSFVGSYDSSVMTNPTERTAGSNATLSTNGTITADHNGVVQGSVYYGPAGGIDVDSWTVSGQTQQLGDSVPAPEEPTWAPAGNPGSITNGDYVHPGGALNGGTYWFTSLTLRGPLTFNGPATVYVNGDIKLESSNAAITASDSRPPNLVIYQIGDNRKFVAENNAAIKAVVIAPRSDFEARNNIDFYGQFVFRGVLLKNTANFYFDESAYLVRSAGLVQ